MSTCSPAVPFNHTRGASFQLAVRIPSRFADGHFAGWAPASKVVTEDGEAVATLDVQWQDPGTARVLLLRCLSTDGWPIGLATFDVRLTSPDGFVVITAPKSFYIVRGATSA